MAQVLSLVPRSGLEAVLVAAELALESAPPSGRVSAEHVLNVLARLADAPLPPTVASVLKARVAPLADTARYDRLRRVPSGGGAAINTVANTVANTVTNPEAGHA